MPTYLYIDYIKFHHKVRGYPRSFNGIVCLLILLLTGFSSIQCTAAENGRTILQKSLDAYQHMNSYSGKSVLETVVTVGGKVIQTDGLSLTMEIKRPNKIHMAVMSPKGSSSIFSDGSSLFVYDTSSNQYMKGPAASTLLQMLPELFKRARILALIDPLGLISRPTLPKELLNTTVQADASINGHSDYVVTGQTKIASQTLKNAAGKTITTPATSQNWKWWIDKSTFMFDKIEIVNPNVMLRKFKKEGKKVIPINAKAVSILRNNLTDCKANPPMQDSIFVFNIPSGATEHRSTADILRGSK